MADDKKGNTGAIIAGVAGAVIGAAAGAAAVALSDEKNRKKVQKVAGNIKNRGGKLIQDIQDSEVVKQITEKVGRKEDQKSKKD